jgi:hypothetical protein
MKSPIQINFDLSPATYRSPFGKTISNRLPARHREQVAIPRWLSGIGSQGAVRMMGLNEVGEIPVARP